jgi:hypothetical protein
LHLKVRVEKVGFTPSENDPCLFVSDKVKCIVYHVDDTLIYSPKESYLLKSIEALKKESIDLELESDVAGFLGVLIIKKPDGTIHVIQSGVFQIILTALNMVDYNTKETPVEHDCLSIDKDGDPLQRTYSYPSAHGMCGYLEDTLTLIPILQQVSVRILRTTHGARILRTTTHGVLVKRHWRELASTSSLPKTRVLFCAPQFVREASYRLTILSTRIRMTLLA